MPWYELRVTPEEKRDYVSGGRILLVWDERPQDVIAQKLGDDGSVTLERGAFRPDKSTIETRGAITVMAGHLISIEDRADYNDRFPNGPLPRAPD